MTNFLAILVSSIIAMVIGSLWYGPLFGKPWMKLMNFTKKNIDDAKKKGMAKSYFAMFVSVLVMNYVLSMFVSFTNSTTFVQGMITGFWIWLGFLATTMLGMILWESKPFKLYLLNIFQYFFVLIISGGILAIWH